jgi:hypothetical protein
VRLLEWDFGAQPFGRARAVVVVPVWNSSVGAPAPTAPTGSSSPGAGDAGGVTRFPVLIALHGRGEAVKAPADGAMGWPRDYAMVRAIDRLRAPPLRATDYEGLVEPARLGETNAALSAHPFAGLVIACPWLPDLRPAATGDISEYTRFLLEALLPRVRAETPALSSAESTGIDGVSLGGAEALRIGLAHPEVFGAVGAIQPAVSDLPSGDWAAMATAARAKRPGLKLHLLTSHEDYFHDSVVGVSRAWASAGIPHDFADLPGPHDYVFNRGPGSIELLLWHDRALAR